MIPKRVFTIWFNDTEPTPPQVKLDGYERVTITLDNFVNWSNSEYVKKAVLGREWSKAADYLRLELLYYQGGIYLDASLGVVKPFDEALGNRFFASWDGDDVCNVVIGSQRGVPLLREVMYEMEHSPDVSGSFIFSKVVQTHLDEVSVYPSQQLYVA